MKKIKEKNEEKKQMPLTDRLCVCTLWIEFNISAKLTLLFGHNIKSVKYTENGKK